MKLKNAIKLSHRVAVYVPSRTEQGGAAESFADEAATLLSGLFGGATSSDAVGYWVHDSGPLVGSLVRESVRLVFAYAEALTEESVDAVVALCEKIKREAQQEAVALEIDGELYLI